MRKTRRLIILAAVLVITMLRVESQEGDCLSWQYAGQQWYVCETPEDEEWPDYVPPWAERAVACYEPIPGGPGCGSSGEVACCSAVYTWSEWNVYLPMVM